MQLRIRKKKAIGAKVIDAMLVLAKPMKIMNVVLVLSRMNLTDGSGARY